jgi:transposase
MAPPTRSNPFRTPSPEPLVGKEATTTRRCRFFDALARNGWTKSMRSIATEVGISEACGRKWKKQCEELGPIAKRKTRQRSKVLGRKSRVTKSMYKKLCSPSRNPVRKQPYKAQIAFHKIPVARRQLQWKLREHTKGGGWYKCAFVKKVISAQNHAL